MRLSHVRYAFFTTYTSTVFVKRVNDFSFRLSRPFPHNSQNPSVRELFFGFSLMALSDPNYDETHPNIAAMVSAYLSGLGT